MSILPALAALFLSYANGANDNFKGVATLYGGKVLSYRLALAWATVSTFAGSLISYFLAAKLLATFSGKGIVTETVLRDPAFAIVVALGAGCTVMLATWLKFPVSTTHSIVGALTGCGLAAGGLTSFPAMGKAFFLPLVMGPAFAVLVTIFVYWLFHLLRVRTGLESSFCLCVGQNQQVVMGTPGLLTIRSTGMRVAVEEEQHCRLIYPGRFLGMNVQRIMDAFHFLSAGAVSFARGINDTPKIAALMLMLPFLEPQTGLILTAGFMAVGGAIHSRRIARRMSFEIADMNPGQAFTANLVTATLVIFGSVLGLPLSTTHVSCGSLFGIGVSNRTYRKHVILQIVLAWIITLPLGILLGALLWIIL